MKKILLTLMMILIFPALPVWAEEVKVELPDFPVTFNGMEIENKNREFPLIVYNDITYIPMTYYDCRYLGLGTDWNSETSTLSIEKTTVTCAYRDYQWTKRNWGKYKATVSDFNLVVNGKKIDVAAEEYPLLTFRDVTYFPLTWRFAVEEFGWDYAFDKKAGLMLNSDNMHAEKISLPHAVGKVVTDGKYYYYNGDKGEDHVVYRLAVDDTSSPEVIFTYPDSGMSRRVNFIEADGEIYFEYYVGGSPVMSTKYSRKILPDGTLTEEKAPYYSYGNHGTSEVVARENGLVVRGEHPYFDSATEFSYEKDGVTTEVNALEGRIRIGQKRNGQKLSVDDKECIKIFGDKVYYTAVDLNTDEDSALYCLDTKTGKTTKLLDGVCGFHVYKGWVNEAEADSTMIIYDQNGHLMRYTELNQDVRMIENQGEDGLILKAAVGDCTLYTVQKTIGGDRTVVKIFDCYGSGYGSITGVVLMDTRTGTYHEVWDDRLCVYTAGEAAGEELRLLVVGEGTRYYAADTVDGGVYVYGDTLLYSLADGTVVKVNLAQ